MQRADSDRPSLAVPGPVHQRAVLQGAVLQCSVRRSALRVGAVCVTLAAAAATTAQAAAVEASLGAFHLDPLAAISLSGIEPRTATLSTDGEAAATHPMLAPDACDVEPYGLVASDFNGITISAVGVGLNWFVAERLSVGVFGEAMYVNQAGDNAAGGGAGVLLRWYFARLETFTLFGEAGVGFSAFDGRVPDDGTSVDFTPRAAIGAHIALDATTALSARVGWLHLSNAQTGENNPGIDTLAVSLGLHIAF